MWLRVAVDSVFWTLILQVFFLLIDIYTQTDISSATFTLFGFLILYVFVNVTIANMRYTNKASN